MRLRRNSREAKIFIFVPIIEIVINFMLYVVPKRPILIKILLTGLLKWWLNVMLIVK